MSIHKQWGHTEDDYLLALQLSEELNKNSDLNSSIITDEDKNDKESMSCVDPRWETLDPIPDIRGLFLQFNTRFFWGKLSGIEVKWSPRMMLCAGICCYEGRGGLCSVRLSMPLLKLRPRKDLVETLLHEMIHAYLFVTDNNKDHDGHGPEFCKHMNRINKETGASISIYHSFHDEVDLYRQHWWRCGGPCKDRKPYYGYVKRAMNRAPSPRDTWWSEHMRTCGGTYTKVKEPDNYKKKGKKDTDQTLKKSTDNISNKNMDIRTFGGTGKSLNSGKTSTENSNKRSITGGVLPKHNGVATVTSSSGNKKGTGEIDSGKGVIVNGVLRKGENKFDRDSVQNSKNYVVSSSPSVTVGKSVMSQSVKSESGGQTVQEKLREVWAKRAMQATKNTSKLVSVQSSNSILPVRSEPETIHNGKEGSRLLSNNSTESSASSKYNKSTSENTIPRNSKSASRDVTMVTASSKERTDPLKKSSSKHKHFGGKRRRDSDSETSSGKKQKLSSSEKDNQKIDKLFEKVMKKYDMKSEGSAQTSPGADVERVEMNVCPVCNKRVPAASINAHLDGCLGIS
ncbi:hypothetical protein ScPMuIL_014798 [Solemya velum]